MAAEAQRQRRRVVVVGGGFGGLELARKLRRADVEVTLVDRMNHHLFQPLLYQVATGGLASGECAYPIRVALRRGANTRVLMAEATDVDVENRQVVLDRGERVDYDSLVLACGARTSYFGRDEWSEVSYGLKTLADAISLRNGFYEALEQAERTTDPEERREWMTFVVVGGGPTGVEVAGQVAIILKLAMKHEYREIDARDSRIILLNAGDRLVPAFGGNLCEKVANELNSLEVTIREQARATAIDAHGVTVETADGSERIPARTVIWAAGVQAEGLASALAKAAGATTDRAGRVQVNPDLTLPGHPEISVIGDCSLLDGPDGKPLPGLATVAIQQARHVAKAIAAGAPGASTPFRYFDKGILAVVGRGRAVCEIRGHRLSGRLAFMTYLTVHLYYLGGAPGHRLKVLLDWIASRLGFRQNQVIEGTLPNPDAQEAGGGQRAVGAASGG